MTLVELCAGTAAVSLWALGRCSPLTGYMGSKRRWSAPLVEALGVDRPDHVVLVDAGPWGDAWSVLRQPEQRWRVAAQLDAWQEQDPETLFDRLVIERPPADGPAWRVAQFLWLQARSAGTIPVWWGRDERDGEERWARGSRSATRPAPALESSRRRGDARSKPYGRVRTERPGLPASAGRGAERAHPTRCRGIQHPRTIAARVRALDRIDWSRVEVIHGDVREVEPIAGATVYVDPPYAGCPRYAATLPRADVLDLARRWAVVARVAVSEGEPLPLDGWTARRLAVGVTEAGGGGRVRRAEWVTASWPIPLPEQLSLPGLAA